MRPRQLLRFGTLLLWAGVLVWAPYFILRLAGESPSLWMYLPFHLIGVIGGARMRMSAKHRLGIPVEERRGVKRVAHILVIASVLIWIPYYGLKLTGRPVDLAPFLTIHLLGIFSGTGLMVIGGAWQYFQGKRTDRGL